MTPAQAVVQKCCIQVLQRRHQDVCERLCKGGRGKGKGPTPDIVKKFHCKCRHKEWSDAGGKLPIKRSGTGALIPTTATLPRRVVMLPVP